MQRCRDQRTLGTVLAAAMLSLAAGCLPLPRRGDRPVRAPAPAPAAPRATAPALDRLSDDHREVLVLRHLEGLSADETGRRIDSWAK